MNAAATAHAERLLHARCGRIALGKSAAATEPRSNSELT